jgi:multidrug efflux pump subunit AcrA (membrane-fusion protein)
MIYAGIVVTTAAACSAPPPDTATAAAPPVRHGEVTLTADEQRDGGIMVAPSAATDRGEELRVPGRVTLAEDLTWRVGVRADGVVVAALVNVGDYVKKGQVLARYHADELRDSRAAYRAAKASLMQAEAAVTLAQRNATRAATLLELKAGSQVQLEHAQQDLTAAQATAQARAAEVQRLRTLLEDDLRVPADPADGDPLGDQVPILSPGSGFVLQKNVTLGRAIHTEDDTFVVGDLSQVWVLASVRQEQLDRFRTGQPATVTLSGSEQAFAGRVTNLGQELDPQTRTMQVRIVVNNPGHRLRPEMLATAVFPLGGAVATVVVPSDAVQQVDGQDVVFVRVAPDRFAVRAVRPGRTANGMTPILEGLKPGEPIVTKGSFVVKSQLLRASLEESD